MPKPQSIKVHIVNIYGKANETEPSSAKAGRKLGSDHKALAY